MAYFGSRITRKLEPQELIVLGGGVNTSSTPFDISKAEALTSLNTISSDFPALSVRAGRTAMYGTVASPLTTPNGVGIRNNNEVYVHDATAWKKWGGSNWSTLATVANTPSEMREFVRPADRLLLLTNATDQKVYNGSAVSNITSAPKSNIYTADDYRVYGVEGSVLECSDILNHAEWVTGDSATIPMTSMEGTATAMSRYQNMTVVWSATTMHLLLGSISENFKFVEKIQSGCVGYKAHCTHNGVLYFVDHGEIKAFTGGVPSAISEKVKFYLDNMNYTHKAKVCAIGHGNYLYISIPYGTTATTNTITLVYDIVNKVWHPWNFGILYFYKIENDIYGIDTSGVIWKLNSGTADGATAITWSHETGVWFDKVLRQRKVYSDIYVNIDLPLNSTCKLSYATVVEPTVDDWISLYDFEENANEQIVRVQIPTSVLYNAEYPCFKFSGTGPCTIYHIEPHVRIKRR